MPQNLIPNNPVIKYKDYKKITNFLKDEYSIILENINPYEFFRIDNVTSELNKSELVNKFFKGKYISLPTFTHNKDEFNSFTSFEEFTSTNEVKNISLWGLSCINNLSFDSQVRLGKELEILQAASPRDGRLDIVALSNNNLLILEAKTTLFSLLSEGRFKSQIPAYQQELLSILNLHKQSSENLHLSIFLLIGGYETDLYPPNHPDCTTGNVGNISEIFYDLIQKYNIKFISANSLWALSSFSQITKSKTNWDRILPSIFNDDECLGLLSGGKVVSRNGMLFVDSLNLEF